MTGLDIIVLFVVGLSALGGFTRGFVQEALALGAWVFAVLAVRYFHGSVALWLEPYVGTASGAGVLGLMLITTGTFFLARFLARKLGEKTRKSVLGPVDRVLGFGFGTIKGALIVMIGFSLIVLGYDTVWGEAGRPAWITDARSYPLVNAGSEGMVTMLEERRQSLREEAAETPGVRPV